QAVPVVLYRHRVSSGVYVYPPPNVVRVGLHDTTVETWQHACSPMRKYTLTCLNALCFCTVPGPSGSVAGGGDLTLPMILMGWVVVALVLFLLRPSSLRGARPTGKPSGPHNSERREPPAPPVD
ncbi:hypothetical protein XENORESO_000425, partial [Xenotaenia resolanae]